MRYSSDESDPGYAAFNALRKGGCMVTVYLDGVQQRFCCIADDVQGLVHRCKVDAAGDIQVKDDAILMETIHGKVTFAITALDL